MAVSSWTWGSARCVAVAQNRLLCATGADVYVYVYVYVYMCVCVQGMLTIGACLLGADAVTAVDADGDALAMAAANLAEFESMEDRVSLLNARVTARPPWCVCVCVGA